MLTRYLPWPGVRYFVYRAMQTAEVRRVQRPEHTTLVMIDNEEYWTPPLDHRMPLKRDYLAKVVSAVAEADPAVIAIDVIFSATDPDGKPLADVYAAETTSLREALVKVKPTTTIVLPVNVTVDARGDARRLPTLFDDLEPRENVRFGFTRLAPDLVRAPTVVRVSGRRSPLPSFPLAITSAVAPVIGDELAGLAEFPFTSFLEPSTFDVVRVRARDVLAQKREATAVLKKAAHKVVIIGGDFVDEAGWRDSHPTLYGPMTGALLVANYVEAMLVRATKGVLPRSAELMIEIGAGFLLAAMLVARGWRRVSFFFGVVGIVLILPFLAWQNFGFFFDVVPMGIVLALHAVYERWRKRRHETHRLAMSDDAAFVAAIAVTAIAVTLIAAERRIEPPQLGPETTHVAQLAPTIGDRTLASTEPNFLSSIWYAVNWEPDFGSRQLLNAWSELFAERKVPQFESLPPIDFLDDRTPPAYASGYLKAAATMALRNQDARVVVVTEESSAGVARAAVVRRELVANGLREGDIVVIPRTTTVVPASRVELWLVTPPLKGGGVDG